MSDVKYMLVHPRLYRKLVDVVARDRWARAYRAYRLDLRDSKVTPGWDAHAILSGYEDAQPLIRGEVGRVQGTSIITTVQVEKY